jgi:hypothetical protein
MALPSEWSDSKGLQLKRTGRGVGGPPVQPSWTRHVTQALQKVAAVGFQDLPSRAGKRVGMVTMTHDVRAPEKTAGRSVRIPHHRHEPKIHVKLLVAMK